MVKKKDGGENIRVVIRCRNLLPYELERGDKAVVRMDMATQQVVVQHAIGDPDTWAFDGVYNNQFAQRDIFLQECQGLVDSVMNGYNTTVFAYGQSGSGKTHTMTGNLNDPTMHGMLPQSIEYLFGEIKKQTSATKQFKVKVGYVELYNGKSRDLLAKQQVTLEIKQNMSKNFYVKGAEVPEITDFEHCMRLFNEGTLRRQTASTDLNEHSSRSHSLFQIVVENIDFEQDPSAPVVMTSKMNIVDLAGSEKLSKTNASGDTAKEGCNINLSLSALATVIDKIVKGEAHIPYRGSPLTMLLKDSLGGNSKTVMFANIGPSDKNVSETISTLRFAERAKQIKNKPIKNMDPKDARIAELLEKIEELQHRLGNADLNEEERLKSVIEELEIENADLRNAGQKDTIELEELCKSKEAQVSQLMEVVQQRDKEMQSLKEDRQVMEVNLRSELEHVLELKNATVNFIRRVCTEQQIEAIRTKVPIEIQSPDGNWDVREVMCYLDGFQELYEDWRHNTYTADDLKREVSRMKEDALGQLHMKITELEREKGDLTAERDNDLRSRQADTQGQSMAKVESQNLRDENAKLKEKIERDQEKFKKKVEKMREEHKQVMNDVDAAKLETTGRDREIEKMKKLLEESGMRSGATTYGSASGSSSSPMKGGAASADALAELESVRQQRDRLELRLKETNLLLRKQGIVIKQNPNATGAGGGGSAGAAGAGLPTSPDGEQQMQMSSGDAGNDAFILTSLDEEPMDSDLIGQVQMQLRVQHRLHELRHAHQRKLDDMIRKYELLKTGQATGTAVSGGSGGGSISDDELQAKIAAATRDKDDEIARLKAEHEKTTDKLVGKINKKLAEFSEKEAAMQDDRAMLEEDRNEIKQQNEQLGNYNQQISVELETLRGQVGNMQDNTASEIRLRDNEIAHLKREIQEQQGLNEQFRKKADEYDNLQMEFERLKQQLQRSEAAIKEKAAALDNNRQMIKWSNSLLETEKKRVGELEDHIGQKNNEMKEAEETWRQQLIENANKLVAINNKRLEEQAATYQAMLTDEQEKQKAIREKLKKAKAQTQKAAQRYDEMVLENEMLLTQFEELKVSAMKIFRDKQQAEAGDQSDAIRSMIRGQQRTDMGGMGTRRF